MTRYAHITGWGMAVPEKVLTNNDIAHMVDTTDEWITSRTGIRERRIAAPDQSSATLATDAALEALEMASIKPGDVDLIIVATSSPEYLFPATACVVQDNIGAKKAGAFDLSAACSGFIYALNMAAQAIQSGAIDNALVIGAETLSRFTNWQDRNTCILFGDGAGAFVLQMSYEEGGVLSAVMRSDGSGGSSLYLPAGGSRHPATADTVAQGLHYIQMNGREVFRFATRVMTQATQEAIANAKLKLEDIALIIPHQANQRIIEAAARGLDFPMEKVVLNVDRYGNTSTASIPIATCEAFNDGRLQPGDKIVFVGFGAGLTWGAAVAQWTGPVAVRRKLYLPLSYRAWAKARSILRRLMRRLEGLIWGRYL
ncbi:MAG: ketoacyl-ACP synthase III [Anaerolineales bacterium]|nr:MAG: ketoacyl-ACP synthase III [Anaerolineales bacterium]